MKQVFKKLYKAIPMKKSLFSCMKCIYSPTENSYKHPYFKGIFRCSVDKRHPFTVKHYGFQVENEILG